MELSEYRTMYRLENRHWWYVGMQRITTTLIAGLYPNRTNLQILDAGCGTGAAIQYLSQFGTITGCDLSAMALGFCQQRGLSRLSRTYGTSQFFNYRRLFRVARDLSKLWLHLVIRKEHLQTVDAISPEAHKSEVNL